MAHEDTIRRFCDAMNDHDADAVAALADPSIVIQFGPNQAQGVKALRALASQPDPDGLSSKVEVDEIVGADGSYDVAARRVQRWTESNELASEDELSVLIELGEDGLVTRASMNPKGA
jgi:limonene-1,2-epoxide hydrolase